MWNERGLPLVAFSHLFPFSAREKCAKRCEDSDLVVGLRPGSTAQRLDAGKFAPARAELEAVAADHVRGP